MKAHRRPSALASLPWIMGLAAVVSLAQAGCVRRVTFDVTRPAMLSFRGEGNTFTLGAIAPNGHPDWAAAITADLSQRIAHSLNPTIRLLPSGGSAVISGAVGQIASSSHDETITQTCTRTVEDGPAPTCTDANGASYTCGAAPWHMESYDCSYTVTIVNDSVSLEFRVTDGISQQVLFDQVIPDAEALTNPSSRQIAQTLLDLRSAIVNRFARVILPWQETVHERFQRCDGDAHCTQGYDLARAGNLLGAEAAFSAVIGGYEVPGFAVPVALQLRVGEALYNRAVTRAYLRRDAEAAADLQRAITLQPRRTHWPRELAEVQAMARDTQALQAQGVIGASPPPLPLPSAPVSTTTSLPPPH